MSYETIFKNCMIYFEQMKNYKKPKNRKNLLNLFFGFKNIIF